MKKLYVKGFSKAIRICDPQKGKVKVVGNVKISSAGLCGITEIVYIAK